MYDTTSVNCENVLSERSQIRRHSTWQETQYLAEADSRAQKAESQLWRVRKRENGSYYLTVWDGGKFWEGIEVIIAKHWIYSIMPLSCQPKIGEFCGMCILNIVLKSKADSISFTITKVEKQKFPTEFLHDDRNQNDLFRSQCLTAGCAQMCVRKWMLACRKEALLSSRYTVCKVPELLSERTHGADCRGKGNVSPEPPIFPLLSASVSPSVLDTVYR